MSWNETTKLFYSLPFFLTQTYGSKHFQSVGIYGRLKMSNTNLLLLVCESIFFHIHSCLMAYTAIDSCHYYRRIFSISCWLKAWICKQFWKRWSLAKRSRIHVYHLLLSESEPVLYIVIRFVKMFKIGSDWIVELGIWKLIYAPFY